MAELTPGFMGIADAGGDTFRCYSMSMNPSQNLERYNTIYGLRDEGLYPQNPIYRPSVKIVKGSLNYPCTDRSGIPLLEEAKTGSDFSISLTFTCGISMQAFGCKVESFSISCSAGDVLKVQVSFVGIRATDAGGQVSYTQAEKLITWDTVNVNIPDASSFQFNITNPIMPIYTAGTNNSLNLWPRELRVGIQTIKGNINYYTSSPQNLEFIDSVTSGTNFSMESPAGNITANVIYTPYQLASNIGPISGVLDFEGADDYFN